MCACTLFIFRFCLILTPVHACACAGRGLIISQSSPLLGSSPSHDSLHNSNGSSGTGTGTSTGVTSGTSSGTNSAHNSGLHGQPSASSRFQPVPPLTAVASAPIMRPHMFDQPPTHTQQLSPRVKPAHIPATPSAPHLVLSPRVEPPLSPVSNSGSNAGGADMEPGESWTDFLRNSSTKVPTTAGPLSPSAKRPGGGFGEDCTCSSQCVCVHGVSNHIAVFI